MFKIARVEQSESGGNPLNWERSSLERSPLDLYLSQILISDRHIPFPLSFICVFITSEVQYFESNKSMDRRLVTVICSGM